ncbi:ubiquitin carboxyl-terminal hydrolase CYLD isoform X2 [Toxorhynchites rutilus septentrionalis]|nr:ubiquitin carboxyl-terminal hydrolase CYLD isoform X2 [Toxorhynchites rutilus septentrionalis]
MSIPPNLAFILAANWLVIDDFEHSTKHSNKNLIEDLFSTAKDHIQSRLVRRNGGGKRQTELGKAGSDSREEPITRSFTPEPIGHNRNSADYNTSFERNHMDHRYQKRMAASVSSPNLSKQDSSSSTGSSSRIINNHPMDRMGENFRYVDSQTEDSYRSGRSSQTSSNNSTLKHSKTRKKTSKSGTILSLEDRDLIIIDNTDIKEATSNESDVIIVDPPAKLLEQECKDVDLKDILGRNWPPAAGEAAMLLNSDKKTQTPSYITNGIGGGGYSSSSSNSTSSSHFLNRYERNKSMNPLSHLANSKPGDLSHRKEQKIMIDVATMAEPNNGASSMYDNGNNIPQTVNSPPLDESEALIQPSPLNIVPDNPLLEIGSVVEVDFEKGDLYGVICWIGPLHSLGASSSNTRVMVGIELEEEPLDLNVETSDGTYNGIRLFKCAPNRAVFVYPAQCNLDRRFQDFGTASLATTKIAASSLKSDNSMFGKMDCPVVIGAVPPLKIINQGDLDSICGKFKGIQGHHNSCYLDATLFAMFTFTSVFDSLLFRPREPEDNPQYDEVQRVLREEIVNPLRKHHFVRADRVMKLRQLLDRLSSVTGLTSEEKDPEEFLNSLLAQILRADPFLKLSSGLDTFYYQLFVEKDDQLKLPSVQQLFEQSFLTSNIKLKEVPSCLIIQMPRFGKNFKMYPRILPSQVLDVTDIIEDSPRQCTVCGKLAEHECRECFGIMQGGVGLESTAFCEGCLEAAHKHVKRQKHTPSSLTVPKDFKMMAAHCPVPRLFMELFAVVCIETSHYVAFVKTASGQDAPWVFFDSMADRKGEQNGYNIPEMIPVPDLPHWLSEDGARQMNEKAINDKMLPEHAKRLLCDAYMCMYQSTDVMMYR